MAEQAIAGDMVETFSQDMRALTAGMRAYWRLDDARAAAASRDAQQGRVRTQARELTAPQARAVLAAAGTDGGRGDAHVHTVRSLVGRKLATLGDHDREFHLNPAGFDAAQQLRARAEPP